ncbi:proline-rich protein 3-like [Daphnia magna]|uniref:proline-rich protein 3-like n=1 Tax=Daphnia magna TaxID=35525 RepID=UPI001E1BC284|nr:proline-rich protein 3-like [Daphnia magna]
MQFFVLAALIAVAAANSAYPEGPTYPTSSYNRPSYSASTYETGEYPAQPYSFNWAVNDGYGNDYSHYESSDSKVTTGTYRVVLPDGRVQIVTYKADDYGYTADVKYEGEAKYPAASYSAPAYSAPAFTSPPVTAPAVSSRTYSAPVFTSPAVPSPAFASPAVTAPASTSRTYSAPVFTSSVTVPGRPAQPSTVPATGSVYITSSNVVRDY